MTVPSFFVINDSRPSNIEVAPGKFELVLPVPCHVKDHPPVALDMSLAPLPTIIIFFEGSAGRVLSLFFNKTKDSLTACLAISL